jgi:hypothetical protein
MTKRWWLLLLGSIVAAVVIAGLAVRPASTSAWRAHAVTQRPIVPFAVQRLIKKRAPLEAYIPTWLPTGWHYYSYENLGRSGFDIYFAQYDGQPDLGLDAVRMPTLRSCTQGPGATTYRYGGVTVQSFRSHNDQEAWRCITHAGVHVLLTVHSGPTSPRLYSLVRMDATLRYLAR